ncbi:hypothetical protein SNE40_015795 [Patella caerulea]|uniref:Type-1 angiotensin II receptor-associated protein n=1 Tax=Patella caerulea TaxID=87958 RepID=A0AAN8JHS4_PATCE
MNPPNLILKVIVFTHFILSMWASQSRAFLPNSYVYLNAFVLVFGIIGIFNHESSDAILLFIVGLLMSIVQDIIFLGIYEPRGQKIIKNSELPNQPEVHDLVGEFRFSLGMCILNLIIKPVTIFLLLRILRSRTTDYDRFNIPGVPNIPGFGAGATSGGTYENIDQPSPYRDPIAPNHDINEKSGPLP